MNNVRKYLIVNADDFGMSHSTNEAINDLVTSGCIKSTTVIVNAPWVQEAIEMLKCFNDCGIGVHITHTSEWNTYRWRPLTSNKTLTDENGYFPKTTEKLLEKASIDEMVIEAKAQVEFLLKQNIQLSHIDNHMRTFQHDAINYLDLAKEYNFGCRFSKNENDEEYTNYAKINGVFITDYLNPNSGEYPNDRTSYESMENSYIQMLRNLPEGVTEFFIHPAKDSEELRAIAPDWRVRAADYKFFKGEKFKQICKEENIEVIGYHNRDIFNKES